MSTQPLVSVIIPVYNKEKYIEKCLESVMNQTYSNLEIILVNDGSKDNSLNICYEYAKRDNRIIVIDQENSGPSAARNKGIDNATGEYIAFVDADDTIELNTYEIMVNNILSSNAQLAIVGMRYIFKNGTREELFPNLEKCVLNKEEILKLFFDNIIICFHSANKLFPREIIGETRYDTSLKMSEDQKLIYQLLKKVDSVVYDPVICYNINYTEGSLSRSEPTRATLAQLDVNEYILSEIQDETIQERGLIYNVDLCLTVFVPCYNNGQFTSDDIKRVNNIIRSNKGLVLSKGNKTTKVKLLLYLISPNLLRFVLLQKRKRDNDTI